jgi:hypothetical protein
MPEANPRLGIPRSRRSAIFRLAVAKLKTDEQLGRVVKTWQAWEGTTKDADDITTSMCPAIRVTLTGTNGLPRDNASQQSRVVMLVEVWTRGSNVEDPCDMWSLVENCLYPNSTADQTTLRSEFQAIGAIRSDWKIDQPAIVTVREAGEVMLKAEGSLSIPYSIQG